MSAHVILRWHLQLGALPLPKSASPERQRLNLDVFGFELHEQEMAAITGLSRPDGRLFGGETRTATRRCKRAGLWHGPVRSATCIHPPQMTKTLSLRAAERR